MSDYFITGTDTGAGKTRATLALMQAMQKQGKTVRGMKPVASGCERTPAGLRNDDASKIMRQCSQFVGQEIDYKTINPYAFEPPIAPHIAADLCGEKIDLEIIARDFTVLKRKSDCMFVEGVGGWSVPLGADTMLSDLVKRLDLQVILVIGLRLGCINHALSTCKALQADGIRLCGWMTSQLVDDYACLPQTMSVFQARISAPFLGSLPYMEVFDVESAARQIMLHGDLRQL